MKPQVLLLDSEESLLHRADDLTLDALRRWLEN